MSINFHVQKATGTIFDRHFLSCRLPHCNVRKLFTEIHALFVILIQLYNNFYQNSYISTIKSIRSSSNNLLLLEKCYVVHNSSEERVDSVITLILTFITSCIEYCNCLFASTPKMEAEKIQGVLNELACILTEMKKYDMGLT